MTKKSLKISKNKFKRRESSTPKVVGVSGCVRPLNVVCNFPLKDNGGPATFDLNRFYSKGFDDIVTRVYYTTQTLLECSTKGGITQSTIYNYLMSGFVNFAECLQRWSTSSSRDLVITDINRDVMDMFILHLRGRELAYISQKSMYSTIKSLIKAIASNGYWMDISQQEINDIFPRNPYPNSNKRAKGEKAFTPYEKRQLVVMLKQEIKPIYQKAVPLTAYELTVCILSIAMQTGINTTPLLKMTTNSMGDHPLKKERKLLTVYKARGNATQLHSLRFSKQVEFSQGIRLDVAYLIGKIIELNSELRAENHANILLVYRVTKGRTTGSVSTLLMDSLSYYIKKLVNKHGLKDEDSKPIRVNISRIRKTFINGIFELSGGDILIAAKSGKHDKKTSNDYYLQASEEAKRNIGIIGEIRVKNLTCNDDIESTPVASCKDVMMGDKAPKDGTLCANFLDCFRCKSFVITGDDLYRVYSFYWAVVRSRDIFGYKEWKKHLRHIIRVIDENLSPQFPVPDIEVVKEKARKTPHSYWTNLDMLRIGR